MTIGEPINLYPWRVVSLAEHEQPALAVVRCQPKDFRASLRRRPGGRLGNDATRYYLASIFDTLLSSQGSDAHQRPAHRARRRGWYPCRSPWRDNCSNLPASLLGRQIRDPLWERPDRSRLDLCGAPTLAPRGGQLQLVLRGHRGGRAGPCRVWDQLAGPACLGLGGDPSAWRPFLPLGLTSRTLDDVRRRIQIGTGPGASRTSRGGESPCRTAILVRAQARCDLEEAISRAPAGGRRPAPCGRAGARRPARAARRRRRSPVRRRSPSRR